MSTFKEVEHWGALYAVLSKSTYAERRTELRKLAQNMIDNIGYPGTATTAEAMATSPLFGLGEKQVKGKGMKGLLMNLHEVALANCALSETGIRLMLAAIMDPHTYGCPGVGRTGYAIGQHVKHMSLAEVKKAALKAGTAADAEEAAPAPAPKEETKHKTKHEGAEEVQAEETIVDVLERMSLGWIMDVVAFLHVDGHTQEDMADLIAANWITDRGGSTATFIRTATDADLKETRDKHAGHLLMRDQVALIDWMRVHLPARASEEAAPTVAWTWAMPDEKVKGFIDLALRDTGTTFDEIMATLSRHKREAEELAVKVKELEARPAAPALPAMVIEASGEGEAAIPEGTLGWDTASEVFKLERGKETFGFRVPVWTWEHPHPHVPVLDEGYIFRPHELMELLIGLVHNEPTYLAGHTGTGKTTLVEQVAARLNWPVFRINFDSEITRMDLIGRDTLIEVDGVTVSKFVDGVMPTYMRLPYIKLLDETDFIRPDVAYVMQRVLENDKLVITEDGGRVVAPHPMSRIVATGNTKGQGDEHGMYQGARPQSLAFLDRFTNWIEVEYLEPDQRLQLIKGAAPSLTHADAMIIGSYVTEHLTAFTSSQVIQPLSPRGYKALARRVETMLDMFPKTQRRTAWLRAFETTVLARANMQDKVVLQGIVNRVLA